MKTQFVHLWILAFIINLTNEAAACHVWDSNSNKRDTTESGSSKSPWLPPSRHKIKTISIACYDKDLYKMINNLPTEKPNINIAFYLFQNEKCFYLGHKLSTIDILKDILKDFTYDFYGANKDWQDVKLINVVGQNKCSFLDKKLYYMLDNINKRKDIHYIPSYKDDKEEFDIFDVNTEEENSGVLLDVLYKYILTNECLTSIDDIV